jgi:hypothetical protein
MCIVVTDFSSDFLVTVVILITKVAIDVWYQVYQFSVVIMVISGTKVINFMVIMVISGATVINFLW